MTGLMCSSSRSQKRLKILIDDFPDYILRNHYALCIQTRNVDASSGAIVSGLRLISDRTGQGHSESSYFKKMSVSAISYVPNMSARHLGRKSPASSAVSSEVIIPLQANLTWRYIIINPFVH